MRGVMNMKRWLLLAALAVAATAAFAPPAQAHYRFPDHITCDVNNGVGCQVGVFRRWTSTHSHMHTIPSAINSICAGAQNRDGTWKNNSKCFDWSRRHADVYYETFSESRFAGWWRGGGAPNWILVEADRLYPA
jgi:hypothetical protein